MFRFFVDLFKKRDKKFNNMIKDNVINQAYYSKYTVYTYPNDVIYVEIFYHSCDGNFVVRATKKNFCERDEYDNTIYNKSVDNFTDALNIFMELCSTYHDNSEKILGIDLDGEKVE